MIIVIMHVREKQIRNVEIYAPAATGYKTVLVILEKFSFGIHKLILTVSFRVTVSCFKLNRHTEISTSTTCRACCSDGCLGRTEFARVRARHWLLS
jgi:hypothetical protein